MSAPVRFFLAALICGVGVVGSFAFARYNPMSTCPEAPPTAKAATTTTSIPPNPLRKVFLGKGKSPCVSYHLGAPRWAVAAAYAAPSLGGTIFGVVVLMALAPKGRGAWRRARRAHLSRGTRIFFAALICGIGVAGAVAMSSWATFGAYATRAPWQVPIAILVGFVGLGLSGALLASGRARS
jgi:hypothetical protein